MSTCNRLDMETLGFCDKTDTKCEGNLQRIQPFIAWSLTFTLQKFTFERKGLARVLSDIGTFRVGGNEQGEPRLVTDESVEFEK